MQFAKIPTHLPYKFMCRVKKIRKECRSPVSGLLVQNDAILLIPDYINQSSARRFLAAWLPDTDEPRKYFELGVFIGFPVNAPARVAIFRKNNDSPDEHYLFVMSLSAEYDLLADDLIGKMVEVESMPADESEPLLNQLEEGREIVPDIKKL